MATSKPTPKAKKTTTLGKVGEAIADAATAVVEAADKHVVHPVGEALGLVGDGKDKKKAAVKKAVVPTAAAPAAPAPLVANSSPTVTTTKTAARRTLTGTMPAPGKKRTAKQATPNTPVKR